MFSIEGEKLLAIKLPCFYILLTVLFFSISLYRYRGYHDNTYPYNYSREYWHLLAARLAFVLAFQLIVSAVTSFVAWVVPDTSDELKFKMEREKEIIKSVFYRNDDDSDVTDADDEEDDVVQFEDARQEIDS